MDMIYTLIFGLFIISLSLYAKPLTTVQNKSIKGESRSTRPVRNGTEDARVLNKSQQPDTNVKGTRPKKQPPKNREKRKNCFGFKMDRISDVSGMGCKSD